MSLEIIFCVQVIRPRTNVVTISATGLLADILIFRIIDFNANKRLTHVIDLSRIVTHERLQLCWQRSLKKKIVLNLAHRDQEQNACLMRMLKEISRVGSEIKA